jgi:hypothetical protein
MGRRILTHTKARPKVDRVHTHTQKQTDTQTKSTDDGCFFIIIIRHFYDNRSTLIDVYGIYKKKGELAIDWIIAEGDF